MFKRVKLSKYLQSIHTMTLRIVSFHEYDLAHIFFDVRVVHWGIDGGTHWQAQIFNPLKFLQIYLTINGNVGLWGF